MTARRASLLALMAAIAAAPGCRQKAGCDLPQLDCGGQCVDGSSPSNCGGCGVTCAAGQACCAGCVDLQSSTLHCGACNHRCPTGATCTGGACVCPAGETVCGSRPGACADLQTDPANCGTCGQTCAVPGIVPAGGATCEAGGCVCHPPAGVDCAGNPPCTSLSLDPVNCGTCGHACAAEKPLSTCGGGACVCGSAADPDDCGTTIGCVNVVSDPSNCGACGLTCTGATPSCSSGKCCAAGETNCSGLCVNLATDVGNCGACGHACAAPTVCQASACVCPAAAPTLCGTTCCSTPACCTTGPMAPCQVAHSNGLTLSNFFDCNPLYTPATSTRAAALEAANSWAPDTGTNTFDLSCNGTCLARQNASNVCAIWCYGDAVASTYSGHVTQAAGLCSVALCNNFFAGGTATWQ